MSWTTIQKVQNWLDKNKLSLNAIDEDMEQHYKDVVFAKLALQYDVQGWLDSGTTPALVQDILALYIAGSEYQRRYSDDNESLQNYAMWLMRSADSLLKGILDGTLDILEIEGLPGVRWSANDFYPNDDTGIICPNEDIKFTMGHVF